VLIIDESQNLKKNLLEEIRLLSNLETEKEKLFQIVLVGQPELRQKLASPELAQLKQRIAVRYHVLPLDESDIQGYIMHRLEVAGSYDTFWDEGAVSEIYGYSHGVPRLINIVCDRSMLLGYVREVKRFDRPIIQLAVSEIENAVLV
jgi:general secretion pathway protein A